ncbi:MAG: cation:proton antiporter [Spirochaetia bacterium]|jgi:Kef-type K+ transport system membrane component KefB|nr:cation:proton antiporter [Spirochaetia bacterium]
MVVTLQHWIHSLGLPLLMIAGIITMSGFYTGKIMKYVKLPSIIGFMIVGVFLGPSLLNILSNEVQNSFSFITDIALSFVAISIGLELKFSTLKKQGKSIIWIILSESFMAFIIVTAAVYIFTKNLPMALIFGSIAPASAPAGTVAIIQEFKAKGSLTSALYSVVGFDDGLGIIIFGFSSAIASHLITSTGGGHSESILNLLSEPLLEILFSILLGFLSGFVLSFLARKISQKRDLLIILFGSVLAITGFCKIFNLSLILTNMVSGMVIVNTQNRKLVEQLGDQMRNVMPLFFVMFFVLAGANLHLAALPSLGILGLVYIVGRTTGLMSGAFFGALISGAESKIRKYLGMGILSQAGVAIGLSLIVKQEFSQLGPMGAAIGTAVITTVTASSIFFEIIGPVLTKFGLHKAGEITVTRAK